MMKYGANIFFNGNPLAMLPTRGYVEGDTLRISKMVVFPVGNSPEDACNQVYALMNADERPNGSNERSLSIGDVIRLIMPTGSEQFRWFACADIGWVEIPEPQV